MSTATGQAMADLIVDGQTDCIDLAPFDPARFGAAVE
jgi:glycine/D-amino acid oxidase-like deaminating enzyme